LTMNSCLAETVAAFLLMGAGGILLLSGILGLTGIGIPIAILGAIGGVYLVALAGELIYDDWFCHYRGARLNWAGVFFCADKVC
jgi:hypothetical protein